VVGYIFIEKSQNGTITTAAKQSITERNKAGTISLINRQKNTRIKLVNAGIKQ
jgi:hypothetical protein